MFQKTPHTRNSPKISGLLNHFNNKNNSNIKSVIFNTTPLNANQQNNKEYNTKTFSQTNVSYMTNPQYVDYSLVNEEIKKKRRRGILDVTSHRNKDIFIETDSEQYNSRRNSKDSFNKLNRKRCSKLIVDKVTSQIPTNYNKNNREIIPYNNNQYSVRTYKTYNNLNTNEINDINNLNNDIIDINKEINNSNEYEYEKIEKIKIKKKNYNDNIPPNNNILEEKRIILQRINNNNNHKTNYDYYQYNNTDKNNYFDRETNINRQKRANNQSYSSNQMRDHNYPFVIGARNKGDQNDNFYKNNKNYKSTYKKTNNNISNDYYPNNEKNILENSEYIITPIREDPYYFNKRRIFNNRYIDEPINNLNKNDIKNFDNINNNIDNTEINSYMDNNEKYKRNNEYNYDKRFKILFFKKDKEYNDLLKDYNDLIEKFNEMKGNYNKTKKFYDNNKNKFDNEELDNNKLYKNKIKKDELNKNKYNNKNIRNNIINSPLRNLPRSKSENNLLNNIYMVEPVDDNFPNLLSRNDELKNYYFNHFINNLKIEQNTDVTILNENKNKNMSDSKKLDKSNNMNNIEENRKFNALYKLPIESYNRNLNNFDNININDNKFKNKSLYKENNDQFELNYEFKKFNENKFNMNLIIIIMKIIILIMKIIKINLKEINIIKNMMKIILK